MFVKQTNTFYQSGISLIELMIGIVIGMILVAGAITVFVNTNNSGLANIQTTRLTQDMRESMDFIHRELQRSGYVDAWDADDDGSAEEGFGSGAGSGSYSEGNGDGVTNLQDLDLDAIELFSTIKILDAAGGACSAGAACSCILYSYDRNENGIQENTERYGFRLSNDNSIQIKTSGADTDCTTGSWTAFSSTDVSVTALTFQLKSTGSRVFDDIRNNAAESDLVDGDSCTAAPCLQRREIEIIMTATSASNTTRVNDSEATLTLTDTVNLKNDYYEGD